ncbi:MAG: ATP-dependent DNA helicase RecG [Patescibacteria group bacterium]|nr:MAG: ATP-dependent DNA helicase RecG [Patescibacteria group bacterium]
MESSLAPAAWPGVNSAMAKKLKTLGLDSAREALYYFPFRYEDFSLTKNIGDLEIGETVNLVVQIEMIKNKRSPRRRMNITEALVRDDSETLRIIWFNQPFLTRILKVGQSVSLSGRLSEDYAGPVMVSPAYEPYNGQSLHTQGLVPVYHLTAGLTPKQLRALIAKLLPLADQLPEWLPEETVKKYNLISHQEAIKQIHFPENEEKLQAAKNRLSFEELFTLRLKGYARRRLLASFKSHSVGFRADELSSWLETLPFIMTAGQKQALWEVIQDMEKTKPMLRLLQGDVGSGKTAVAMAAARQCVKSGAQAAIMAPTALLAKQHFNTCLDDFFTKDDFTIALLTSSSRLIRRGDKSLENLSKQALLKEIKEGKVDIIIGTHALIQKDVDFNNLALAVTDEQHRFGVEQRAALAVKGSKEVMPHLLAMTATPIPRSLALVLYGELDLSVIKDMPPGRRTVLTKIVEEEKRSAMYDFIKNQLKEGRQAFVICPLIDPSDKLGARSVKLEYEKLSKGSLVDYRVGMIHGRLSAKERDKVMEDMSSGLLDVLVATSIIEIGIDIPNASVMVIEDADRFGLAQLHQYRGRVGRSTHQSYCFLLSSATEPRTRGRLEVMAECSSGFILAEADLKFRGPGEAYGLAQSGWPELKMANYYDTKLLNLTKEAVDNLVTNDPNLDSHPNLKQYLKEEENKTITND